MRRKSALHASAGFTLIELMVVMIIIGILIGVALPQFSKTLEISKATDAVAHLQMIATANRMFALDHGNKYAGGKLENSCSNDSTWCNTNCSGAAPPSGCCLIACKYLAAQDWDAKPYEYYAVNGFDSCTAGSGGWDSCVGATFLSGGVTGCAVRKTSGAGSTGAPPYSNWGYASDKKGLITCAGAAPPPPS